MKTNKAFDLTSGEKLKFVVYFKKTGGKREHLGILELNYNELDISDKENRGKININLKIDSKYKAVNSHMTGFEIIDTDFMNIIKGNNVIKDAKSTVHQIIKFDPSNNKISIDETLKWHNQKNEKPITNTFRLGPPQMYDHVSLLYKIRSLDLKQSEIVSLAVLYKYKLYPILVEYQYNENIIFNGSEMQCRVYGLRSNKGELPPIRDYFQLKSARIWISNTRNRLPVRIEIHTQKGEMIADLNHFSKPGKKTS